MAVRSNSTPVPISSLIADPFVRVAFQRAERDLVDYLGTLLNEPLAPLCGGQEAALPSLEEEFA